MLLFSEMLSPLIFRFFHSLTLHPSSGLMPQLPLRKVNELLSTVTPEIVFSLLLANSKSENKVLTGTQFTTGLNGLLGQTTTYFKKGNLIQQVIADSSFPLESVFQKVSQKSKKGTLVFILPRDFHEPEQKLVRRKNESLLFRIQRARLPDFHQEMQHAHLQRNNPKEGPYHIHALPEPPCPRKPSN